MKGLHSTGGMILTGENYNTQRILSQCQFVHHKSQMDCPCIRERLPHSSFFFNCSSAAHASLIPTSQRY